MKYYIRLSKGLAVMAAALFLWGCGKANSNAPAFSSVSGHPANWLDKHRPFVLGKGTTASCKECHGQDLLGGIAKTSCAECHAIPVFPFAPANHADPNWVDTGLLHGAAAKARPSLTTAGINQGFSMCASCHGADFNGGVTNPKTSCFGCHLPPVKVPHPEAPWFDPTGTDVTHTNTDPANAAVCALCHTHGRNLSIPILTHYATGTPGCFNSTLCHGNVTAPHAFPFPGSAHMSVAVAPFTDCLVCHTNSGGVYPVPAGTPPDCRGCHTKAAPGNGCGSCHGPLAGDGRPNGTAFPDVEGQHNLPSPAHADFACTDCHGTAGTGQPTHGPSNGTAHNDANVSNNFSVNTNFTRTGNGHGTCTSDCHDAPSELRTW